MPLKNLTYLSLAKLDLYFPQVPPAFLTGASATVKVNLGVFSSELTGKAIDPSTDFARLLAVLRYLDHEGLLGSESDAKQFVRLTLRASALLDGSSIFFTGFTLDPDDPLCVCLCASAKHILGYDAKTAESASQSQVTIGSVEAKIFNQNSNNLHFAERLTDLSNATRQTAESTHTLTQQVQAADLLPTGERQSYDRLRLLNPLVARLYPAPVDALNMQHWMRDLLTSIFLGPVFFLLLGPGGLDRKRRAIAKLHRQQNDRRAAANVTPEEQKILDAAYAVTSSSGNAQRFECVARRMVQGTSGRTRVLLATPLYMAAIDSFEASL